jgi:hypothetical protein
MVVVTTKKYEFGGYSERLQRYVFRQRHPSGDDLLLLAKEAKFVDKDTQTVYFMKHGGKIEHRCKADLGDGIITKLSELSFDENDYLA